MLKRYFDLEDAIDTLDDDDVAALLPTRRDEKKLKRMLEELKAFEPSSKKLQSADGVMLLDVRDILDALVVAHPGATSHIGPGADVVRQPEFENACVAVLMGKTASLTDQHRSMLIPFAVMGRCATTTADKDLGFADRVLKKRKVARQQQCEYPSLPYIPPTSSICELFFSQAKAVLGNHGLLPIHLEAILFLKVNRNLWNVKTVVAVVNKR